MQIYTIYHKTLNLLLHRETILQVEGDRKMSRQVSRKEKCCTPEKGVLRDWMVYKVLTAHI